VELFSQATRGRVLRRLELEAGLRVALETGRLEVHYQPQVDLVSGRVRGVEALARWTHPQLGPVPPPEFVAIAEETGLIGPLGAHVLDAACRQLAAWRRQGLDLIVSVNVSVHQLEAPDFAQQTLDAVRAAGLPPHALCVEITESAIMGAGPGPLQALEALKAAGIYVAIDDFGTGYSSLAALKRLPVEVLKVDRSFVDGLGTDSDDTAIVSSVMSLAHAMGLHVIAEGVETPLQADGLLGLGCTMAQGWLYAPAVAPEALRGIVARMDGATRGSGRCRRRPFRGERFLVDEMMRHIGLEREQA
jgi:EAL domain-containing protein (putative c-di-GMP-specific phosphodiesterase class I)